MRKNIKRFIAVLLAATLVLALGACGDKKEEDPQGSGQNEEQEEHIPTLQEIAASMQDYSHAPGEDAAPISTVDDNLLLLVNKTHPLSENYKASDLTAFEDHDPSVGSKETWQVRAVVVEPLKEMFKAAEGAGFDLCLRTGYRSYSYQKSLFDSYAANHGIEEANKYSALPGESEHQTGLCLDVGMPGVYLTSFTGTDAAKWVAEHCHEYGFILRYPKEKESITGYIYESWHIRYVGVEAASEIYENNQTLEEFLGVLD